MGDFNAVGYTQPDQGIYPQFGIQQLTGFELNGFALGKKKVKIFDEIGEELQKGHVEIMKELRQLLFDKFR